MQGSLLQPVWLEAFAEAAPRRKATAGRSRSAGLPHWPRCAFHGHQRPWYGHRVCRQNSCEQSFHMLIALRRAGLALEQEFRSAEWELSSGPHVRFGSEADICAAI